MQYAIVHKQSRVVRGLTTDPDAGHGDDVDLVALAEPIDLADGPRKLKPDGSFSTPTESELDDAIPERRAAKMKAAQRNALDAILADQRVPETVRTYFALIKAYRS